MALPLQGLSNNALILGSDSYVLVGHPTAPNFHYVSETKKSYVYRLQRVADQTYWALKIPKRAYPDEHLAQRVSLTGCLRDLPGLRVLDRTIVKHALLERYGPTLLMPWIMGPTWGDLLSRRFPGDGAPASWVPDVKMSLQLCVALLCRLAQFEARSFSHGDVASGNLIVELDCWETRPGMEFIDVESGFLPGTRDLPPTGLAGRGEVKHTGTPGYQMGGGRNLWGPLADRFSACVMCAEMLLVSDPTLSSGTADGLFFPDPQGPAAAEMRLCLGRAGVFAPRLVRLLQRGFDAADLFGCPPLIDLNDAARSDLQAWANRSPGPVRSWEPLLTADAAAPGVLSDGLRVTWEPLTRPRGWPEAAPPRMSDTSPRGPTTAPVEQSTASARLQNPSGRPPMLVGRWSSLVSMPPIRQALISGALVGLGFGAAVVAIVVLALEFWIGK